MLLVLLLLLVMLMHGLLLTAWAF